ncbi:hypothetical protein MKZ38_006796 [Zalerion maritima]|uniref:Uncharacterized protein n=1 Tax=Zalerion maritima TaxID=339359 RepID=A0AAD5WUE2_9PEZI|nr:hypothetical protein MKZ38_006796 [Zalerion maritima]
MGRDTPPGSNRAAAGRHRLDDHRYGPEDLHPASPTMSLPKCDASGCRAKVTMKDVYDPRRLGFQSQYQGQEQLASRYCSKHTCSVFHKPNGNCQEQKSSHDDVCVQHTTCSVNGCPFGKVQYVIPHESDGQIHYRRYDYCGRHLCNANNCSEAAFSKEQDPGATLPYCKKHRCQYTDCDQQKLSGDRPLQSPDRINFCSKHFRCEAPQCPQGKIEDRLKKGEYHKFCALHIKCESPMCEALKMPFAKFCVKHVCTERNCNKGTDIKWRFCIDREFLSSLLCLKGEHAADMKRPSISIDRCHDEECDAPRCWVEKTVRGKYCAAHSCRSDDCDEHVETKSLYCEDHECTKENCLSEAAWEDLCGPHLKHKYDTDAKAAAKAREAEINKQLREENDRLMAARATHLEARTLPFHLVGQPQFGNAQARQPRLQPSHPQRMQEFTPESSTIYGGGGLGGAPTRPQLSVQTNGTLGGNSMDRAASIGGGGVSISPHARDLDADEEQEYLDKLEWEKESRGAPMVAAARQMAGAAGQGPPGGFPPPRPTSIGGGPPMSGAIGGGSFPAAPGGEKMR